MRHVLRHSIAVILLGLLTIPQVDARGSGGGDGFHGGFHGGFRGSFHIANRFGGNGFGGRSFLSHFPSGFNRTNIFSGWRGNAGWNPAWAVGWWGGGGWGAWGWPIEGWGDGGYYAAYPPQQAQAATPDPQVIVIHTDGEGRMTTVQAEGLADYGYVKGCHAIPSDYHCDIPG